MTNQEALLRWLRIAWEKGQQTMRLAEDVAKGMPLEEAVRELDAPLPQRLPLPEAVLLESPHFGRFVFTSRIRARDPGY